VSVAKLNALPVLSIAWHSGAIETGSRNMVARVPGHSTFHCAVNGNWFPDLIEMRVALLTEVSLSPLFVIQMNDLIREPGVWLVSDSW
jgi:hypothetical protein